MLSPARPPNTRAGSPVELAVPTLCDNVDEELGQVNQILKNIGHTHTYRFSHNLALIYECDNLLFQPT